MLRSSIFASIPVAFLVLGGLPQTQADTLIRNVRVFDGTTTIPKTDVLFAAGKIKQIGDGIVADDDATLVDGTGKTLLPGLIDAHTHSFLTSNLEEAAIFGVTTELDMFSDHRFVARMRSEKAKGEGKGRADLFSAGTLVTAPKGHGTQFGISIPTITGPDEADDFVAARIAEGSDYIKIVYDDGKTYGIQLPTLDRKTLAAVVNAAHERGKMAVVHIGTAQAAHEALEAGADGLVHICADEPLGAETVALAAMRKAFVVPTLTVLETASGKTGGQSLAIDERFKQYLTPESVTNLKTSFPANPRSMVRFPAACDSVKRLKAAGVPILAGTDSANPGTAHGASLHRELELLVRCGLTPEEALAAATSVPADRFGLVDRGMIAVGRRADAVLVEGDPTQDILATRAIVTVWKEGQIIPRDAWRDRVSGELQRMAATKKAPPPANSESGLVSDFEKPDVTSEFGAGWSISTDLLVGGKSVATLERVEGGADESKGSLRIKGNVEDREPPRWAGVLFSPGTIAFAPANLSVKKEITFWAKGDGKEYVVMLFSQERAFQPSYKSFKADDEWKRYRFAIREFDGCDGTGILGLFFGGSQQTGEFKFQIDDVRFEE